MLQKCQFLFITIANNLNNFCDFIHFSSRDAIYGQILRLTQKTDKIQRASTQKYAQDDNWIQTKLREGKWKQIRDISQKPKPAAAAAAAAAETPISPLSPKRPIEEDLGKGKRIKTPNPKYNNDPTNPESVYVIPTALNFDDLGLEIDNINDDKTYEIEKKQEKKPKRKKIRLEQTIIMGERFGLPDHQIAMMYNAGSM